MTDLLHITVGAAPTGGFNLTHELNLLKAAILYADKIKLCSLSSAMAVSLPYLSVIPDNEALELVLYTAKTLNQNPEKVAKVIDLYRQLQKKKYRTRQELLLLLSVKGQLDNARRNFKVVVEKLLIDARAEGLFAAIQSGLVEIQSFDFNKDNATEQYVSIISNAVLSGQTYPLLDDFTGDLIRLAIKEGKIIPIGTTLIKAKQAGLSSGLFERLPLFEEATIDEIIDIRKELDKPLTRFRSAIVSFSRNIEHEPWAAGFPDEVEQVFIEHIEPAVLDIEDAYRSNKLLVGLVKKVTDKPLVLPGSSALGLLLSQVSNVPIVITQSLALVAGSAAIGLEAVQEWQQKNREIEKNQLYFYYKVKKSIE